MNHPRKWIPQSDVAPTTGLRVDQLQALALTGHLVISGAVAWADDVAAIAKAVEKAKAPAGLRDMPPCGRMRILRNGSPLERAVLSVMEVSQ